ncbi:MAG: nucleotide exchange factor GrpE [Candidatus Izemoplasmatales bacterium]|nr:nucleotide exchange factor GrpE [Candidatus Izemoplasmatales bacterium]MDD4069431.1 nucleotide exchange factor GrpE [Candidatus Izemoplasmatales bacterium]MDY0139204.1 nucleotide exchange factor GrpE [Candidatus Izemoplasmatales bacterium]
MSEVEKELVVEPEKELTSKKEQVKEEKTKKKKKSSIENQLESVQEELQNVKDKYYRNLAEMENFKKRMNEDLKKERKYAGITMADKLIDSLEVFDQALNMQTEDKNMMNFLYGFKMIKDMMFNALKDEGVVLVESKIGDDFDPNIHEAMDKEYNPEQKENTILKVVKKGYKFKDRILRPAMVVINIKPEEENKETESNIEE